MCLFFKYQNIGFSVQKCVGRPRASHASRDLRRVQKSQQKYVSKLSGKKSVRPTPPGCGDTSFFVRNPPSAAGWPPPAVTGPQPGPTGAASENLDFAGFLRKNTLSPPPGGVGRTDFFPDSLETYFYCDFWTLRSTRDACLARGAAYTLLYRKTNILIFLNKNITILCLFLDTRFVEFLFNARFPERE